MSKQPFDDPPPYSDYSAPSEPPPSQAPPDYPPPPGLSHDFSTGANASKDEAVQAANWCAAYPLMPPFRLNPDQLNAIHTQYHTVLTPPNFHGSIDLQGDILRIWRITTNPGCKDTLFQTALPEYSALADSPLVTERPRKIYFEVKILSLGPRLDKSKKSRFGSLVGKHAANEESGVAIGYFAPPYPPFRLPGWQRGSLGVHSDDGRRYVGNTDGGVDFTTPFIAGETVGIGMIFRLASAYSEAGPKLDVEVFFTRNGRKVGGWDLNRDTDAKDERTGGLQGDLDLFPAVGIFGPAEVEVNYAQGNWLYQDLGVY